MRRLSPLLENGILRLREVGAEGLIDQLWNFPKHRLDDRPDALEMAVRLAEGGAAGPMVFANRFPSRVAQLLGHRPGARLRNI